MKNKRGEWRVLYDPTGAIRVDDPSGAEYSMVYVVDGKIVNREGSRSGFTHDFREKMKEILQKQIDALDKPYLVEEKIIKLKEMN